jgi:RNA polymerase sigma factor (TIGR02999 family)
MQPQHGRSKAGPEGDSSARGSAERGQLDLLFSAAYEELRRLASSVRRTDFGASVSPTSLVNEAWVKLAGSPEVANTSPLHFKRIAARAMRQVLVEAARRKSAGKRGGGVTLVTLTEGIGDERSTAEDVMALDQALTDLAKLSPRQAQMVEGRFFGGLEVPELAELMEVSEATVLRDWRAARAWLARELQRAR